jgi:hypothetical protein
MAICKLVLEGATPWLSFWDASRLLHHTISFLQNLQEYVAIKSKPLCTLFASTFTNEWPRSAALCRMLLDKVNK